MEVYLLRSLKSLGNIGEHRLRNNKPTPLIIYEKEIDDLFYRLKFITFLNYNEYFI